MQEMEKQAVEASMFGQMAIDDGINLTKQFPKMLRKHDTSIDGIIDFIDAPLQKVSTEDAPWSLKCQVEALENRYDITGIKYAIDESLAEAVLSDDSSSPEIHLWSRS